MARLAGEQHGTVSRAQLLKAEVQGKWIDRQIRRGRLIALYRGVYAVGHLALTRESHLMAALLACGPSAALSHRTAAIAWGLLRPEDDAPIDITITQGHRRSRPGVRLHHAPLMPSERGRRQHLPLTGPLRTLLDLAASDDRHLARAAEEAQVRHLVRSDRIETATGRGSSRLRAVSGDEPTLTRSDAERLLLKLVVKAQLPRPQTNVRVHGHEVDAHWPSHGLIVEVDGYAFHRTRQAFERDRRRDALLESRGLRVIRTTWRQLTREPEAVAARLGAALGRAHVATYPPPS